ncbi:MAG: EFR1 family ferrodoxin [bacterium]
MSATIYYFTGTGNSLKIARDLTETLDETELVPLARATEEQMSPGTDIVGMVFPVYAWGAPLVVRRFLDRVRIGSDRYVFAVCTCGSSASGTLVEVKRQLCERGITLSSGFIVKMPTNYIIWDGAIPEEKQQDMFGRAKARIDEICAVVKEKRSQEVEMGGFFGRVITGWLYRLSMRAFPNLDKKFTVSETCNSCGICERVCQVGNIEIREGKPSWLHSCEQCLACLQWCPQEAIQIGEKTIGRKRYHHPEVKARDLM